MTEKKKVCHVFRRYSNQSIDKLLTHMNQEFTWFEHLRQLGYEPLLVKGSDRNEVLQYPNFSVHLIKTTAMQASWKISNVFVHQVIDTIRSEAPALLHMHSLLDVPFIYRVQRALKGRFPIIVQDHGSVYATRHQIYRPCYHKVDGFIFNSPGQELPWNKFGLVPEDRCFFAPEATSNLGACHERVFDKATPNLLVVGNLSHQKGTMTVIQAIRILKAEYPQIRCRFIYKSAPLLEEVERYLSDHDLKASVELLGTISHEQMHSHFCDADLYLSASGKEGSGYSAIEAMSVGLIPVLSDIPSFVDFTENGQVGALFKKDDPIDLARKVSDILNADVKRKSLETLSKFNRSLSAKAVGRRLAEVYAKVLNDF
ncbi:MAG: glycosyltransferase family 4 protein [Saprospiraceae bacterium]|nr:glycosyltransferase family 4 protein [Saprospiraceae bacterium]